MATLNISLPEGISICDGKQVTFRAPCDCTGVTTLLIDGLTYELLNTAGETIAGGSSFVAGSMVLVIIDTEQSKAYIQSSPAKLYDASGSNTDGVMTQKATTDALVSHNESHDVHNGILQPIIEAVGLLKCDSKGNVNAAEAGVDFAAAGHKHSADDIGADKKGAADSALTAAKKYTDEQIEANKQSFAVGVDAPEDTTKLWIDITEGAGGLKYHNGSEWVVVPVAYS